MPGEAGPGSAPYLHGVGLPGSRLSIREDADVEAVDTGSDQSLHFLEHLKDQSENRTQMRRRVRRPEPGGARRPSSGAAHLLLQGLRREDLVQFKGHDLSPGGQVEDGVVVRVEAQRRSRVGRVQFLLADGSDPAEHPYVT